MKYASLIALTLSSLLVACGASDDGDETGNGPMDPMNPMDPEDPNNPNDPNAADPCGLNSGWKGDELCILPPEEGEGIQLHVGPASYDNPHDLEPYVMTEGEDVRCYYARIPESGFYYLRQENRMRSGSHHMLINLFEDTGQEEGPTADCSALGVGSIPGSQTPSRSFPDALGPEDEGLARYLPEGTIASFQLHYVHTGEDLLREAWVNLYKEDESKVTQRLQSVFLVGDILLNIPPMTRQTTTLRYTPPIEETTRIFQLNSHSHAHTESFTVWRVRGDERELIYQSFDWEEPDVLTYNTVTTNHAPDPVAGRDGGHSGLLFLEPGDTLEWSCDVNNDTPNRMGFANEAYTAEMCLLSGSYISPTPGLMAGVCANGNCSNGFFRP